MPASSRLRSIDFSCCLSNLSSHVTLERRGIFPATRCALTERQHVVGECYKHVAPREQKSGDSIKRLAELSLRDPRPIIQPPPVCRTSNQHLLHRWKFPWRLCTVHLWSLRKSQTVLCWTSRSLVELTSTPCPQVEPNLGPLLERASLRQVVHTLWRLFPYRRTEFAPLQWIARMLQPGSGLRPVPWLLVGNGDSSSKQVNRLRPGGLLSIDQRSNGAVHN